MKSKQRDLHATYLATGRVRQKERTRRALIEAARQLFAEGVAPTVAASALRASISEATAYRYYSSTRSLLKDALVVSGPDLKKVLEDLRALPSVEERARLAAESMARTVLANEAQVRAVVALSYSSGLTGEIDSPAELRPAFRIPMIDAVLEGAPRIGKKQRRRLRLALSVVIGAEAVLSLKDLGAYSDQEIISTLGRSAYNLATAELIRGKNEI
jgi:AcrR family transcriptional regulator